MTTIPFKPGASGPFAVRFTGRDGGVIDYGRAQLRIDTGSACLLFDGELVEDRWQFDLDALDLPKDL